MTDWKTQIGYKYNPSYHAYAYGLVYQPGPEQNHGNHGNHMNPLSCWSDSGVTDLSNYNAGVPQAYYTATSTARAREESPPGSPEQQAASGQRHYQGPGVVHLGDAQAGRLLLARPHRAAYDDARAEGVGRVGSDSTSDSEAHTSPDSWSSRSSSSREGGLPQTDPATWVKRDLESEERDRSPISSKDVSSSLVEEPETFTVTGNDGAEDITPLQVPIAVPNKPSPPAVTKPKGKVRAAFSESQMNTLVQRFRVQRYLTPAEMKNLAEMTGLTYQQVKTWFQNRRVKLKRHQKDTSWVSEQYTLNKDGPVHGTMYNNIPPHIPSYRGEAQSQLKEHYNQHMMKATPQNLAFYLAAMGGTPGSAGYPSWSAASSQTAMPTRPQATGWSMPPGINHYEYNHNAFNASTANNTGHNTSFETKDESVNS
ncbi:homeobox protein NANOG [Hippoglossus hippoglossus]|uniref:homeobox protein NANOG n=1 Tax=Hippoglossus hippoglossus TaxID=8267 RepID=UPI00148E14CF|nr:homeobox protein NANOG [Hippoglossus hippoglossus]